MSPVSQAVNLSTEDTREALAAFTQKEGSASSRGGEDRDRPTHTSDCAAPTHPLSPCIPLVPASPSGASLGVQVFLAFRSGRIGPVDQLTGSVTPDL